MSGLGAYWPKLSGIDECIRTEAETVDDAVLLAVHEPGPLRVRAANGSSEEQRTETDLLESLLRSADDGSAVVVAITGDSGVGKSHMIRWLHAQLQRHSVREGLVIVLVPKTASLRQVVERILEPLKGDAYEQLKSELSKSIDSHSPNEASQHLATALAIELEKRAAEWMGALRASSNKADPVARDRIFHAKELRELLRDGKVFDNWLGKVLHRIVSQTISGGSESASGISRRFTPDDLESPAGWDVTQATQAAQRYLHKLQSHEVAARETAAAVLQEVLDPALRVVFRFSEALGQRTIEDIVDDIRKQLLVEGKELVLLIEDFAALAGIQQPLLNLMIAESDHQGKRIRAPIRTALAVTDGFLPSRQTILTRAKQEWVIPSVGLSEDQLIKRLIDLAGRYLNAARWGVQTLREQFSAKPTANLNSWVTPFQAELSVEESKYLSAFGVSRRGFPLFPLSPIAVESLCRKELRSGGGISFNPRAFINHVLRDTLLQRPKYEAGAFPPPGFKDAVLSANADFDLRMQAYSPETKDRLGPLLVYWAGDPQDLHSSPTVERGLFEAFGLPWPYSQQSSKKPLTPPLARPAPGLPHPPVPAPRVLGTDGLVDLLDKWAQGSLPQKSANHIRVIVANALSERLNFNLLRMRKVNIPPGYIFLPFVQVGNPTASPRFEVAKDVRPVSAIARKAIAALDRYSVNKASWDYEGADDDYAAAQCLLDDLEQQANAWLVEVAEREAAVVSRTLHRQSLMLGISGRAVPPSPRIEELCATDSQRAPPPDGVDERSPVGLVLAACAKAVASRPQLQDALKASIGCFQGVGTTLHCIDFIRLSKAWKRPEADDDSRQLRTDSALARDAAIELSATRLPALLNRYRSVVEDCKPIVDRTVAVVDDIDWISDIKIVLSNARKAGLTGSIDNREVNGALEHLSSDAAQAEIRGTLAFTSPEETKPLEVRLAGWSSLDVILLSRLANALKTLESALISIEREAKATLNASGGRDAAEKILDLENSLRTIEEVL